MSRIVSPWLGVVMAWARMLIVYFPLNPAFDKFTEPLFAFISIVLFLFISLITAGGGIFNLSIDETGTWTPLESCGYPSNYTEPEYGLVLNEGPLVDLARFLVFLNATFKNLPAIILPFLTIVLIRGIRKAQDRRKKLRAGNGNEDSPKDNTTQLVTYMTVFLVLSESTVGITILLQALVISYSTDVIQNFGVLYISTNFYTIFNILITMNSTVHCIICMRLSSQYKQCVVKYFPCIQSKKNQEKVISVIPNTVSAVRSPTIKTTAV
ncbi:hypothetical protein GCK72_017294 [Caenorhabditis remanei]|uniref:G-protein coupled receptors family 1 profile domain-containing protein n=1 Tax=Caenorhabditis remanei TaxID=31234 RepID=A0A6A5G7H9_CAERE|nr:hypothetical protein GCK72_017294 [Caenorhabditis remanei]KAF1750743.1 hypothetical protein GCK72_017294 [Caenorhabditis remanei]